MKIAHHAARAREAVSLMTGLVPQDDRAMMIVVPVPPVARLHGLMSRESG